MKEDEIMNRKEHSMMSIAAFGCTLVPILSIVGIVLGIIDLKKKDESKHHYLSVAAIVIGTVFYIVIAAAVLLGLWAKKEQY